MFRTSALALGIAVVGAFFWRSSVVPAETTLSPTAAPFDQHMVWGTWKKYCDTCHFGPKARGNVNLETLDLSNLNVNGATWEKVLRKLRGREMPPPGALRPDETTYKSLVTAITTERDRLADTRPTPGRPTLHRLNRAEYGNAVRDLLGLQIDVSELLPPDDSGYGFDNIGDVLTVSPELLERYLLASGKVARQAVGDTKIPPAYQTYTVAHGLKQNDRMADDLQIGSRGGTVVEHLFPVDGEYEIAVELQRGRAGELLGNGRVRKLNLRLDDQAVHEDFTIPANRGRRADINTQVGKDSEQGYKVRIPVKAGMHTIAAAFEKDTVLPEGILFRQRFDAIQSYFEGVGAISIAGPYNVQGPGETVSREKIFICHPTGASDEMPCAEKILANLAHHAYRRPVAAEDIPALLALYKQGAEAGGFEQGIRLALQKVLVSPNFLFRVELDPANASPGGVRQVSDIELASRLSFFLWSSIPDDELLTVAEGGKLRDPAVLEGQVRRMLADPRSQALVQNFAGQWLFLRNIPAVQPDPAAFPTWDENLRQAMKKETELWLRKPDARGSQRRRSADDGLHLRQSAPGRALRHEGHLGQRIPPRRGGRPEAPGLARAGQHHGGDLLPQPDGTDGARQVGAGAAPGYAPAPAASERSVPEGRRGAWEAEHAATHGGAQNRSASAPSATRSWTRSASRSRTSTGSASGAISEATKAPSRSIPPEFCRTAPRSTGPPACATCW